MELLKNPTFYAIFCLIISVLAIGVYIGCSIVLGIEQTTPANPKGWGDLDYDAAQGSRDSLQNYMAERKLPLDTPMNQFTVATASFGGIFTEDTSYSPWIGHVSPEAARLQVEAGARAMVLDIWPDPANLQNPIVAAMKDLQQWYIQHTWIEWGLNRGVGRYSNWNRVTRNKAPVADILNPALKAAFHSVPGKQNTDPFFLILRLHGAMTKEYLDTLGSIVRTAIGQNSMGTEWNYCQNQSQIFSAPVSDFLSKVFLIVLPDIQSGYNSLPNINTYPAFTASFLSTSLGEITNAVEQVPNTMAFEPSGSAAIAVANQPPCKSSTSPSPASSAKTFTPQQTLAQVGFCTIQPSIGGSTSDNSKLYKTPSYEKCMQTGAQFVAVNYFSPNSKDSVLSSSLFHNYFGKYSFHKN